MPRPRPRSSSAHVTAVISSRDLGVSAVAAAGDWCASYCAADTLPERRLRRRRRANPLVAAVLKLRGHCVNGVQLHVNAAGILGRCGVYGEGFR